MKVAHPKLDAVSMILRTHLLVEYYLDHIILSKIPRGDILLENKFSFSQKVSVVEALDILQKEDIQSIKKLNSVRNSCSHKLDYNISETEVDLIGRPYGKKYLAIKEKHFQSVKVLLHWTLAEPILALAVEAEKSS